MWRNAGVLLVLGLAACLGGCGMNEVTKSDHSRFLAPGSATPTSMPSPAEADKDYHKAIALLTSLKYGEAEPMFFRMGAAYESYGQYAKAAECMFWRAYCQEKLGRGDEAAMGYEEIKRLYADTPAARQARARLDAMGR